MARDKLDESEIRRRLREMPEWSYEGGKLHREFRLGSFVEAFGFMSQVALLAEKMNHHPELCNVYSRVTFDLETHDAGGVSEMDFRLAAGIDEVWVRMRG